MRLKCVAGCVLFFLARGNCLADSPVTTPRPVPATRPEMKQLLEDVKKRPSRIPLPELTEQEKSQLGQRGSGYEARLRQLYVPTAEGTVFGGYRPQNAGSAARTSGGAASPSPDFTRNADENMSLTYQFKTMLFWIVSRTNNCQYCLGHQEWKLSATGMKDDAIAALDCDWSEYSGAEQAAFAYARTLTYEPQKLSDECLAQIKRHYSPLQVLEMTMSVSGNNAINRWKEGAGIPQSSGNTFAGRGGPSAGGDSEHSDSFTTPTSDRFKDAISVVAPLEILDGKASGRGVSTRPVRESRSEVMAKLAEARQRTPRLPLTDESTAKAWLKEAGEEVPATNWIRLIANFRNEGRGRLPSLLSRERKTGALSELQKGQLNWILARQDRAWYAVGLAYKQLRDLGQSDDQIFALDGDWRGLSESDRAIFTFANHLGASPIASTDEDAAAALHAANAEIVVQTINHVASCAYFNRVTEAAGLPLDP